MSEEYILRMEGITKIFPGVKALDNAKLELRRGEVLSLIGENGAGKSTLMKILLGIYSKDGGEIFFEGKKVNFHSARDALDAGISMIHQEISLIPSLSVSENIWLGREKLFSRAGMISTKARNQATKELLKQLNIHLDIERPVNRLRVAQMQLVEIARAVSYNARVVIMDEPTSALSDVEIEQLYAIIRGLTAKGVSVIFISHKIDEIFTICQRVTVMRDGCYIDTRECGEISEQELVHLIAGREIKQMFPKEDAQIGDVILEAKGISGEGFKDVSFTLHKGEILGFCGLMGAGRTEIMNAIFGITRITSGELFIKGERCAIHSPAAAIKKGIGMVTEDRLRQGVIHVLPVRYNMSMAYLPKICKKGFVCQKQEKADCAKEIQELQMNLAGMDVQIGGLSGGNQQKAVIGRWLLSSPDILIMDEPTRGIDVGAKTEIHRLLSRLAKKGMAIIMVSSELPEILGMSDRILVVREGKIAGEFARGDATQDALMNTAFGVAQ